MKRLTILFLGLSLFVPFNTHLNAGGDPDSIIRGKKKSWNFVLPKLMSVAGSGVGGYLGYKSVYALVNNVPGMISDSVNYVYDSVPGKLVKGTCKLTGISFVASKIGDKINFFPYLKENFKDQACLASPLLWGTVGATLAAIVVYKKLYRYTLKGICDDAERWSEALDRKEFKTKLNNSESNLHEIIISNQSTSQMVELYGKILSEIEEPIIEKCKKNLPGCIDKLLKEQLEEVIKTLEERCEVIKFNKVKLENGLGGQWQRHQGQHNVNANEKRANAQEIQANAAKSATRLGWVTAIWFGVKGFLGFANKHCVKELLLNAAK